MDRLVSDLRYGWRALRRRPGFTTVALLMLALGIGVNTAIFSVVNGVLLEPLPYAAPERLVEVTHLNPREPLGSGRFSPVDFEDLRRESPQFESVSGYFYMPNLGMLTVTGDGEPARLQAASVDGLFFRTLGMAPLLGRWIDAEHDNLGRSRVVVLSESLWRTRYGARPDMVGRTIQLEGGSWQVLGVMPQRFQYPGRDVQAWVPVSRLDEGDMGPFTRGNRWLSVVARLRPATTVEAAEAQTGALLGRLAEQFPETNQHWTRAQLTPLHEEVTAAARTPLLVLLGAVGLVLLIASANLANLLLARASGRSRELAVRAALGAGRRRLGAQIVVENLMLAGIGGVLGVLLSVWGVDLIVAFAGAQLPRPDEVVVDARVLAFGLGATLLAGLLASVLPALRASAAQPFDALREGARGGTGASRQRTRALLVVGETAIAVVLLTGSVLMLRSVWQLMRVDPGFAAAGVIALNVTVPGHRFDDTEGLIAYRDGLLARLRDLPGVIAAGGTKTAPLAAGGEPFRGFTARDATGASIPFEPEGGAFLVSPDYFRALGTRLVAGREFRQEDPAGDVLPLIVNQAAARRYWPDRSPIGEPVQAGDLRLEVVGVAQDVRTEGLAREAPPAMYVLWAIAPRTALHVFLRTASDPATLLPAVRAAVREYDAELPIGSLQPLTQMVSADVAQPRFLATLLGAFAAVAVLLAALGIYGVIAYAVTLRAHEIGIRMALGALRASVVRMVIGQALRLAGLGIAAGLLGALWASRALTGLLHGVSTTDPITFVLVPTVLVAVAALAAAVPAVRAARVDPMVAFRNE
ncbi:MAG TPA: ABC transporter permease [Longimicrobiales bacterium]|nr:ABC transporter permease [Longimicrobiales bacterium]